MAETPDITDTTDWLHTPLGGLAAVESALRCQVCKDFYNTPMITHCSHTFCSICIRRALSNDGRCPVCRATEQAIRLRPNISLEEAVVAFVSARSIVIQFATNYSTEDDGRAQKRKPQDESDKHEGGRPAGKRIRQVVVREGYVDSALIDGKERESPMPLSRAAPDDGLVECPVCLSRMKATLVDRHLDTSCPGLAVEEGPNHPEPESSPVDGLSTARRGTRNSERLPSINYSILKDVALRKKLADLGLSTSGPRLILERRHKEWITIWNANCDSARPKKTTELMSDLRTWERALDGNRSTAVFSGGLGGSVRDKDFDGAAWAARHDESFKDLIARAKNSRTQPQDKDSSVPGNASNSAEESLLGTEGLNNPDPDKVPD